MIKTAIRTDKIRRLNETSLSVLLTIANALGDGIGRVEYGAIAKATGIPRGSVAYSVAQLIRDGTVELVDEQLCVRNSIIWFEED